MTIAMPTLVPKAMPTLVPKVEPWVDDRYRMAMPSKAYGAWLGVRGDRISELLSVHASLGGAPVVTSQLEWALTLRLAGEFQGFCRDLHDLSADFFAIVVGGTNKDVTELLRALLTADRRLDRGNAGPDTLKSDFLRLGLSLWDAVAAAEPATAAGWKQDLNVLNRARNAIAHAEEGKLAAISNEGYPLTLQTVRRWSKSLDGLACTMDEVVGDALERLLGGGRPW